MKVSASKHSPITIHYLSSSTPKNILVAYTMKRGIAALASLASLVSAQSINIAGIPVATPTGVFNLPVVYATAGQPAVTATTLAVSATASSDPSATSLIDAAARASVGASSVQRRRMRKRDGTCAPQPSGITHQSSPDTPAGFVADPYYAQAANNAAAPAGYTAMFTNLNASNSANQYMGYTLLPSYDVQSCASKCSAITGCNSVNIYFERDPTVSSVSFSKLLTLTSDLARSQRNQLPQPRLHNQCEVCILG